MAKDLSTHFSKENIQMANKPGKMLNIISRYGNVSQNHNDTLLHTHEEDSNYNNIYVYIYIEREREAIMSKARM